MKKDRFYLGRKLALAEITADGDLVKWAELTAALKTDGSEMEEFINYGDKHNENDIKICIDWLGTLPYFDFKNNKPPTKPPRILCLDRRLK